ncbi:MAG: porin family protein [Spirochaetota bacterium]
MKRLTALLIVLLFVAGGAFALELTLGLKGGVGHFDAWGSDYSDLLDENEGSRALSLGGSIGAFGRFGLVRRWSLQPELLFTSGGQKYDLDADPVDDPFRIVRRTIEVPVLVRRQFNLGPLTLAAFAGPNVQFKVGEFKQVQDDKETEIPDQKPMAFGADVGVGMDFQVLRGVLTTDVRYSLGFTPWDDSDAEDNTKPQSVRLFVGYGVAFL